MNMLVLKKWKMQHYVPATVFMICTVSLVLLLWVGQIAGRLRASDAINDAIIDLRMRTAMYHLRLEEAISGSLGEVHAYNAAHLKNDEVLAYMDQAMNVTDVVLNGGQFENVSIIVPLKESELRRQCEAIRSLLVNFKAAGRERLSDPGESGLGSVPEMRFEAIFNEILSKSKYLEDILQREETANRKKAKNIFFGIKIVWALVVVGATAAIWKAEKERRKADEAFLKTHQDLLIQTEDLAKHSSLLEELVEQRTEELTRTIVRLNDEIIERKQAEETLKDTEKQIRHLSSRLLTAQEIERKRISMELHDALGQALHGIKLHIRLIEKRLGKDQKEIREDCIKLLEYMDGVIEDVRRLSLDLSPTIIEDLGLTSAVQWLASSFKKTDAINVTTDIGEIDHLVPENQWIVIYRVIQEALCNISKHARPRNVSISIGRKDDRVAFSIEDDGKGFDLEQAASGNGMQRGLGMTTMSERVSMIGGVFDIWSVKGKGTRITFNVPVKGGA